MSREQEYNDILQKYFGYEKLKDLQFDIIRKIIKKKDVLSLLPTSYGKSLCYQMPYLITKKNVIVVSPLISLMEDQMQELNKKNIPTICLNSTNKQKAKDIQDLMDGNSKIIYTTPEYLVNNHEFIENLLSIDNLALIAIDECHCISSWGHSFRSEYTKLNILKQIAPDVPILALTATSTEKVLLDIIKNLNLKDPKIIKHSIDRPNLYLEIDYSYTKNIETTINKIEKLINENTDDKTLIYCKTINDTEKVTKKLKELKFNCESYHSQKNTKEKTEIQQRFTDGDLQIIISTIAFGMGINIPNIRLLIHFNCSNDIESYIQEIGRAGRDNKISKCIMFGSNCDFMLSEKFVEDIKNAENKQEKLKNIEYLKKYVTSNVCRRKFILKYFGEIIEKCDNCDICINNKNNNREENIKFTRNFTNEAQLLFSLLSSFENRLGMQSYIKILIGSKEKTLTKYFNNIYYGRGVNYTNNWWVNFICLLISNNYIIEEKIKMGTFTVNIIKLTPKSIIWYNTNKFNDDKQEIELEIDEKFKTLDEITEKDFISKFNLKKK